MALKAFRDFLLETQDKKNPVQITTSIPQYPTGYMYLDYGTGSWLTPCDDNDTPMFQYHKIGLNAGSVNIFVSKSQGGKTSLGLGMGSAIIEPYVSPHIYMDAIKDLARRAGMKNIEWFDGAPIIEVCDSEKTLPVEYAMKVARYGNRLARNNIVINPVTTDMEVMYYLEKHAQFKMTHMKKIPAMMLDIFGRPIIDYPPTVFIVDSQSQLLLEDCDDPDAIDKVKSGKAKITEVYENATKGASGARRARIISAMISQMVNIAKKYNILIISICHINKMPAINGVQVKQYRGLRAGETIGGGERAIFLATNILRLDVIKAVGTAKSTMLNLGEDITGHVAIASWIKSKANSKSNACQLVYTNKAGYSPMLSNLYYEKELGVLPKKGNGFYVPGFEKYRFTLKDYEDVFGEHPELFTAYYDGLVERCSKLLDNPERAMEQNQKMLEKVRQDIFNEYEGSSRADREDAMLMDDMFLRVFNAA